MNTVIFVLTLTDDSSIFRVVTVMITAKCSTIAVHKLGFCATTVHIVQEDVTSSLTKGGIGAGS